MSDYGLFLEKNGNYYKGNLKEGKLEGKGEMEIKGKYKYIGDFRNDSPMVKDIWKTMKPGTNIPVICSMVKKKEKWY